MNIDVLFYKTKIYFCYFVKLVGHFVYIILTFCILEEVLSVQGPCVFSFSSFFISIHILLKIEGRNQIMESIHDHHLRQVLDRILAFRITGL